MKYASIKYEKYEVSIDKTDFQNYSEYIMAVDISNCRIIHNNIIPLIKWCNENLGDENIYWKFHQITENVFPFRPYIRVTSWIEFLSEDAYTLYKIGFII